MWKEAAVAQLEKLSRNLAREAEEYHENVSQDSRYLGRNLILRDHE
jgi:hypothetical protein